MKRLAAVFLLLSLIFTVTACSQAESSDADSEGTEDNGTAFTTEANDADLNEETQNEVLSKQQIYNSVSSFISDIPYNSELYSTYNFTDEGTLFFFQFYIFGTERRLICLLKSSDGGNTWDPQNIQSAPSMSWREHIVCAKMLDESVGIVSGRLHATDNNFSERTYITTNGGRDWTQIVLPTIPPYLNEESALLSNYLDGEAYDLTYENGVYYLHVRVSAPEHYHYFCCSSTNLVNWTYVESTNINESENSSNTDESESTPNVADFSSYEAIIETYRAIVNCFTEYTVEQYRKNECIYSLEFYDEESRAIYERIFFSAFYHYKDDYAVKYLLDGRNYFGYALYDINQNGSDELILLNDHYDIIAIFSNINGTPRLIVDNEPFCRIDTNGKIYTQKIIKETHDLFPWSDRYYDMKIYTLSDKDELTLTEEYIADISFGSDQVFFDVTDGRNVKITKAEYLAKTHDYLYNSEAACITQSSINLDFVRLFEPLHPYLPEVYCWEWHKDRYDDSSIVMITYMNDNEAYIGFYSGKWIHEANVKATRKGETAYFESEKLSGRLEFGLDCIWIIITESKMNAFPCGAYIYEYYETHK